ncbi:hypothetical protein [Dermatobacter hominis]|uniref:hypothetical protein n=1 Tax=Dermatobacter hominis TaxID=2884263 RepID=UPI001D105135|nr:hypothetical protein [Dermatobacter hominis]UDY37061.1 hypothetical protein LH044_05870 [Dermatobacter hominis]
MTVERPPPQRGSICIRPIEPGDGPVVGEVSLRSWLAGYDGLVDADRLAPAGIVEVGPDPRSIKRD